MDSRLLIVLCLAALIPGPVFAADSVEPTGTWSGTVKDRTLREVAPRTGFIADQQTLGKVWKAWRAEEPPKVDFTKELILVGVVPGPNKVIMRPTIESGAVRFVAGGTKMGGPGFGYQLMKISRTDVKTVNGKSIEPKGVQGVLILPKLLPKFVDHALEIKLWEYDPFLADVGAKLVDEFAVKKYSHESGKQTETPFSLGGKLEPRKDRRYYITVFVLKNGRRTHIGEQDGKSGLCKVLMDGKPTSVKMIARAVR